jgi:hypothetical protein
MQRVTVVYGGSDDENDPRLISVAELSAYLNEKKKHKKDVVGLIDLDIFRKCHIKTVNGVIRERLAPTGEHRDANGKPIWEIEL